MNQEQRLECTVSIALENGNSIEGDLSIPSGAKAIVLFAHGTGSSRYSTRNQFVAQILNDAGFATLLVDLLTAQEKQEDEKNKHLRFDIMLLTDRIMAITNWITQKSETSQLAIGYFGSSTGAGAALLAAAKVNGLIKAIVSRGGRLDLADPKEALRNVTAPTLLIVGGNDSKALDKANRIALRRLERALVKELVIIDGAGHLFDEAGKMDKVGKLATEWFKSYLGTTSIRFTNAHSRKKFQWPFASFRNFSMNVRFRDRIAAGEMLASLLGKYKNEKDIIVIGIARGGVIIADAVSEKLKAELDIVMPRKLTAPSNRENAIGAIMHDGSRYLDKSLIESENVSTEYINSETLRQKDEIDRRMKLYRPRSREYNIKGRTVILVDDGAATGATLIVAARWIRKQQPRRVIIAVPVAPRSILEVIQEEADLVESVNIPSDFRTVEQFYQNYGSVEDTEVMQVLKGQRLL